MLATIITDHVQLALARLIQQYQGRPLLAGFITAIVDQIQSLENAVYSLNEGRQLYNGTSYPAVGAQLDGLGQLVGVARNGLSDSEYLVFILGTIAEDYSDSTRPTILNIINTFFTPTLLIAMDKYPAEFDFEIGGSPLPPSLLTIVIGIVQASLGAAIKLGYIGNVDPTNGFIFSDATGRFTNTTGAGFSDATSPGTGGVWAGVFYSSPD